MFVEEKVFLLSFHFSLGKISEAKKKESFNNFLSSKNTHFLFYFWIRNTYVCKQWETWAVLHRKQIKPKGVKFSISLLWKSSMYIKLNIIYYIWTVEMELYNFYRFPHQYFLNFKLFFFMHYFFWLLFILQEIKIFHYPTTNKRSIQYFQILIPHNILKIVQSILDNMILIHDGYQSLSTMKDASRLCVRVSFFLSILIFCIRFSSCQFKRRSRRW